jgi:hypothetical protein
MRRPELKSPEYRSRRSGHRAIGERVYLSHRAVDTHLYRIFPKLKSPPGHSQPTDSGRPEPAEPDDTASPPHPRGAMLATSSADVRNVITPSTGTQLSLA